MVVGAESAPGHAAGMVAHSGATMCAAVGMVKAVVVDAWGCVYTVDSALEVEEQVDNVYIFLCFLFALNL